MFIMYSKEGEMSRKFKTLEVLAKVLKGKRLKPNSQRHYREALGSLAKFSEDWPVSGAVINEWLASLQGFADSTVKMWFDVVNAAGKYMQKAYKVANPCAEAERPKVAKKRRRYFTPDEVVSIIQACKNNFELALVMTLVDSACRIGELVRLKGGDVGDGFINVVGKTGQRRYRLDVRLCQVLKDMAGGDDSPVFKNHDGGFYPDGDGLGHRVRYVVERAGIKGDKIGVHTLRHTSASLLAREFMQPLLVKSLLQHDDIKTSMKYIHDVDDIVIKGGDKYSPLTLVEKRYKEAHGKSEQLELASGMPTGDSMALVPVGVKVEAEDVAGDLVGDMFPELAEGVAVRTVLKYDDLVRLKMVFEWYARNNAGDRLVGWSRELMKRMLRKGGSERYSTK
jgi:integrase/recombinase XerD